MPRHKSLIPLSHDHHNGLVVALRLKKGGPASPNDPWLAGEENQAPQLLHFSDTELLNHFALEEEVLFPLLDVSEELVSLTRELVEEHTEMRQMLDAIRLSPSTVLLTKFGEMLEKHIRKEERILFPLIEHEIAQNRVVIPAVTIMKRRDTYRPPPVC
jgi:iron-sulfur cluster repair protein YtfE (RIC family)